MTWRITLLLFSSFLSVVCGAVLATDGAEPLYPETKQLISLVSAAAMEVEKEGAEAACAKFRQADSPWLDGNTYVFVFDMAGKALCHPAKPSLEGQSLLELRDPHGRPIVRNFLRELEGDAEDGWVHYHWPRPGEQTFYWKSTYVKRATAPDGQQLMVGSGLYQMKMEPFFVVEQVNDAAELVERQGEAAFATLRDRSSGFYFLDAYVFVLDRQLNQLVNSGFPELEGTNTADMKDAEGKLIGQEMIKLLETQEAGWVDYLWPRPGDSRPARKSSFVRRVDIGGKTLIIGAGIYR